MATTGPTTSGARRPGGRGTTSSPATTTPITTVTSSTPPPTASVPPQATSPVVPPSTSAAAAATGAEPTLAQLLVQLIDRTDARMKAIEDRLQQVLDALQAGGNAATTVLPAVKFAPTIRQLALLYATSDNLAGLPMAKRLTALVQALVNDYQGESLDKLQEHADSVFAFNKEHEADRDQVRRNIADLCVARLSEAKADGKTAADCEDELSARIDSLPHAKKVQAEHDEIYTTAMKTVFGEVGNAAH